MHFFGAKSPAPQDNGHLGEVLRNQVLSFQWGLISFKICGEEKQTSDLVIPLSNSYLAVQAACKLWSKSYPRWHSDTDLKHTFYHLKKIFKTFTKTKETHYQQAKPVVRSKKILHKTTVKIKSSYYSLIAGLHDQNKSGFFRRPLFSSQSKFFKYF